MILNKLIKRENNAKKMVKLVIKLLDNSDVEVRDKTSKLIATLIDKYPKVKLLLKDLN